MSESNPVVEMTLKHLDFLMKESEKVEKVLEKSFILYLHSNGIEEFKVDYDSYKKQENVCNLTQEHKEFLYSDYNIPPFLRIMFELIDNSTVRTICGNFNFYSLDEIIDNKDQINNIVDIGYQYSGMGYFTALGINKFNKNTLFFRREGGSNGYDQSCHHAYYKKFSTENMDKFLEHFKTMDEIIEIISESKVDFFDMDMVYAPDEEDFNFVMHEIV